MLRFFVLGWCLLASVAYAGDLSSSYFGSSGRERGQMVSVGRNGDIYIAGLTNSMALPMTSGRYASSLPPGATDAYVARYSPDMKLKAATYLGYAIGNNVVPVPQGMKLDPATGDIYLLLLGGPGNLNGRVTVLSEDLKNTFLSSLSIDGLISGTWFTAYGFDVDFSTKAVYVAGGMGAGTNIEVNNATSVIRIPQNLNCERKTCSFVVKFAPELQRVDSVLLFEADRISAVYYNQKLNRLFLAGQTTSPSMPERKNDLEGEINGFISSLSSDLKIIHSTVYIGSERISSVEQLAFSPDDTKLYAIGMTQSEIAGSIPVIQAIKGGGDDTFVALLDENLNAIERIAYLRTPFVEHPVFQTTADYYRAGVIKQLMALNPVTGDVAVLTHTNLPDSDLDKSFAATPSPSTDVVLSRLSKNLEPQKRAQIGGGELDGEGSVAFSHDGATLYATTTSFSQDFPKANNLFSGDASESDAVVMRLTDDFAINDETPDLVMFTSLADVAKGVPVFSNIQSINGLNTIATISVEGPGAYWVGRNGEQSCNPHFADYTRAPSTVKNGDKVCVAHVASDAFSSTNTSLLAIGTVSAPFITTTLARDDDPDELLEERSNYRVSAVQRSVAQWGVMTIKGINTEVEVSVEGGRYALNCTAPDSAANYTSAVTTNVRAGTQLCVQQDVPPAGNTATTRLKIGARTFIFEAQAIDTGRRGGSGGGGGSAGMLLPIIGVLAMRRRMRAA